MKLWIITILVVTFVPSNVFARQVALVIGNEGYLHVARLFKSNADSDAYAALLKEKGFSVTSLHDLTKDEMEDAIANFADKILPGDTAAFVYSGHGWSDGAQNFVLGVDAPLNGTQELVSRHSISLRNGVNGIIDTMDRKRATLKIAIIDDCRDNPFESSFVGKGYGATRGLAPEHPPSGTFVVFSAGSGQSALDALSSNDKNPNGVFTRVFIKHLSISSTLLEAIKASQVEVSALAKSVQYDQLPAYYDEVLGNACLSNACALSSPAQSSEISSLLGDGGNGEQVAFADAMRAGTREALKEFIEKHPGSAFSTIATRGLSRETPAVDETNKLGKSENQKVVSLPPLSASGESPIPDRSVDGVQITTRFDPIESPKGVTLLPQNQKQICVTSVLLSEDRTRLIAAGSSLMIWDLTSGHLIHAVKLSSSASGVFFCRGNNIFVYATNEEVVGWDARESKRAYTISGDVSAANDAGYGFNAAYASGSDTFILVSPSGKVEIRSCSDGKRIYSLGKQGVDKAVAISRDGKMAMIGRQQLELWDVPNRRRVWSQPVKGTYARSIAAANNDEWIVGTSKGTLLFLAAADGDVDYSLEAHKQQITSISFPTDGAFILSCSEDHFIKTWESTTHTKVHTLVDWGQGNEAVVSKDGKLIVSTSNQSVILWNAKSGKRLATLFSYNDKGVAYTPDGIIVSDADVTKALRVKDNSGRVTITDLAAHNETSILRLGLDTKS